MLRVGLTLKEGLGEATSLYGTQFPPIDCVKALTYFEGADLESLPDEVKQFLVRAASHWDVGVDEIPILGQDLSS